MSPDTGIQEYKYDLLGNMRFMYSIDSQNGQAANIIYLLHSGKNQPVEIGYLPNEMNVQDLVKFENSTAIPNQVIHQRIIHSDTHSNPYMRGKVKLFMTYTTEQRLGLASAEHIPPPHQELLKFDSENNVVLKTSNAVHSGILTNLHKHYKGGKVAELQYPRNSKKEKSFNLMHSYDKVGRLTGLGTREDPNCFAKFSYSSSGQVIEEVIEPNTSSQFIRSYGYNSPGLLVEISDPFLSQSLAFTQDGYGQRGFGDGIIMKSIFNASWVTTSAVNSTDFQEWFKIPENEYAIDKTRKLCLSALKRLSFVDSSTLIPIRYLTYGDIPKLPLICSGSVGHELMKLVAEKLPPTMSYGHRYAYGNHQELTKAKYFSSLSDSIDPLQVYTFFKEIPDIETEQVSETIWDLLTDAGYIITDNRRRDDKTAAIGKEGTVSFFAFRRLESDLVEVDALAGTYTRAIMNLLFDIYSKNEAMIDLEAFKETFINFLGYRDTPTATLIINKAKQTAQKIYEMLDAKGYLSDGIPFLLNEAFVEKLASIGFESISIPIASVLKAHFSTQMGSTVNDYETYEIDSNGNQKLFYVGMSRYTLDYSNGTNHITKLSTKEPFGLPEETVKMYELDHDTLGNVSKAPHRNIQKITYHPVTNRPVYIELTDGRIIVIQYDAQGERILKRVYDSKEVLLTEVKYLRDERGNVLMDIRTKYAQTSSETTKVTTSTYLHGPRGLLGFTRNGKFYSVFSDHAGSVRLITQQGKVVAGYDYWPYGETMKVFGNEDAHIFYRFTGQEWDEEIGLYNFHARLYDPTLGRFFQPDPKSQYYSPYVYAGNSPISLVDPDGEFFLIFAAIIGAIIGAYLGGAAANGNWNPIKWNWKSLNTWLGIIGGGIGGAMLPGGFAALSATIGVPGAILVGLGGSFFSMAIQNENWNPAKWDWTNPGTYNAFFQGFGDGLSGGGVLDVVDQVKNIHRFAKTLGKTGQILFIASSYGLGFTLAYVNGALANENNFKFWEWDFKNPGTLAAIKGGFMFGSGLPKEALPMAKNFRDFIKNKDLKEIMKSMKTSSKQFFKTILKDKRHPLFKAVGKGLLNYLTITIEQCSSEDGDHCSFDITKWDWKSLSTYEGILNGILQNPDAVEMVQDYREGNLKIPKEKLFYNLTLKKKHVTYFLSALQRGMADIASFYFPKVPGLNNRKRNYVSPALFPLLARVIDSNTKSSENADGEGYEDQLRNLLDGISAGSKIYPDTSFGAYLDCHQRNVTMNGINRSIEFELCDIGNGPRKISLRNRELIYKLFVPSIKYRSNVHFFQVHPDVKEPEEFLDQFVTGIQKHLVSNSFFYTSYFAGATFNSLLNYLKVPNANSGTVFIRSEMLPNLDAPILHTALVSNSVVSVRVVVVGKKDDFQRVSDYMQVQQYRCQIPESFAENINSIETQVYFIDVEQTEDKANPWVYTMTPELSTDYLNCEAAPQFMQAKPIDGINSLLDDFETFLESGYDLDAQLQNFEVFVEDVKKLHNGVSEINIDSFLGFLYGLLDCNMKNTYDLKLELGMNESFSILARKTAEGHENWYGTAVVVMSTHDPAYVERSLYSLGTHTLSKHALLATFDNGNLTSKATEEIPTFESILGKNALITNQSIENGIKFIYYTNLDKSRTRQNQNDREFNFHYVSNSILGQFLAHANYKEADSVEISVFTPLSGTPYESRISSQRIFFVKHAETGNYTVINIIESSQGVDPVFNSDVPTNIPVLPLIDNEEVSTVRHLKIKLNINSIAAFSSEPSKATDFFHGIEDVNENISEIPTDSSSYFLLESSIENSIKKLSFDKESIQKLFVTLSENKFRPLTTSELDFNALASGFLLGMIHATTVDVDGIQLQLRNRVSKSFQDSSQEHNLLSVVSRDNSVVPQSTQVLAQNLKFSNESFDVETKFKEASIELQEHYCENRQRLSETWRFTSVPAVFGPKLERTIMFEVNPPSVVDGNCTAEINETNWQAYQKKVVEPFVTSSASKISENGFLNGIFKYFNKGVSSLPKILFDENEYTHSQFSTDKNENLKKEGVSENTVSCQNGAWVDRSYVMNGITCLSKLSKMTVFRITTDNDLTRENFGSLHQPFIGGDTFEKKSCAPVDFNGMPSVTCNGQKTNLVYTPYLQDRLFDNLDANILLGRTLIHLGGKVFGGPSAEERYFKKFGKEQVAISPDMIDILERKLVKIEGLIRDTARVNTNIKIYEELQWAHTKIKDCRDTLEEISKKRDGIIAREELEKIRERVEALHEDVKEQIADFKLSESKAGMYGGTRSEENESKTWSEGNSDTEFQSNSHVNINDFVARNYAGFVSSAANMFSGINVIS
ncbi:tRNA(Glu)-specific nuclease WapA [Orchesella cincta]|uniref:tRNA(Glu)-specific nuclease WapA n=1 Tax=Orchesella cincta TaxID=48709 RepID=A0A1D2MHN7_ORCCI|nr:tRNA(Glu)-specific nuclease WapA [Orchesella cincta]